MGMELGSNESAAGLGVSGSGLDSNGSAVTRDTGGGPSLVWGCESGLAGLLDTGPFRECDRLVTALIKQNAAPALEWCAQEADRLRIIK